MDQAISLWLGAFCASHMPYQHHAVEQAPLGFFIYYRGSQAIIAYLEGRIMQILQIWSSI